MLLQLAPQTIVGLIAAALIGCLSLTIRMGNNQITSRAFSRAMFFVMLWGFGTAILPLLSDPHFVTGYMRFFYADVEIMFVAFFYFAYTFPDQKASRGLLVSLIAIGIVLCYLHLFTNLIFGNAIFVGGFQKWGWQYGPLWFLFDLSYFLFPFASIFILFKKLLTTEKIMSRRGTLFILLGTSIAVIPAGITNVFLPDFGNFQHYWLGPVPAVLWTSCISYAVIRYHQMNVKVIASEALLLAMSFVLFLNIFVDIPWGIIVRACFFLAFLLFSYLFMRSLLKEEEQRQTLRVLNADLNDLNANLQQKVAEQTKEIRKAYEVEKKAREELEHLDEAKNQFIGLAQHHLRTPLTKLRWDLAELRNEIQSKDDSIQTKLTTATGASDYLAELIETLLNITQFKTGTQIIQRRRVNMLKIIESVFAELKKNIEEAKLLVKYDDNPAHWPDVDVDEEKLHKVFFVLIQNAITYNKTGGSIILEAKQDKKFIVVTITDTGIGIPEIEQKDLFTELFHRGKLAQKKYANGKGISLLVAQFYLKAHHGTIAVDSKGANTGTKVTVTLPLVVEETKEIK